MKKHFTKLIVALLALAMLLPIVVQAAPTDGWTDEAEQAYQTLTEKAIQQVTESRDYLSLPIQQRNTRAVYALWTAGAVVPEGFYDAYLQSLAGWLDMAAQNGRCAYIPTAIRTVAAMGLDVTDFAGHDLLDPLRKPDMMTADEDRLNMLLDLSCAGEAGETKEFAALREQLLTEAMARQQSSGQFRYSTIPGTELRFTSAYDGNALFIWLRDKGVIKDPDRFEYILLTAQSVQALAPYQDRKDVSAAIDKALNYLSAQQLPSGGFARFGEENVEEDAAVLEMLATLGISLTDERFTKDGHTVLDGMMGWYQDFYFEDAKTSEPKQGFYHEDGWWRYEESRGWYRKGWIQMRDPNDPNHKGAVPNRIYDNAEPYSGLCAVRGIGGNGAKIDNLPANNGVKTSAIDYKALLQQETDTVYEKIESGWYGDGSETIVSASSITGYSRQVLALKRAQGEFTDEEKEELWTVLERKIGISNEYYMGRKSGVYSPGVVRAITALDMDPADVGGLDFLAPLTNVGSKSIGDLPEMLKDLDAVDASVWRSRGVDADSLVDMYASRMLENQTASGKFSPDGSSWEEVQFTAENVAALAPHTDKEYIAKAIDKAIEYLSSVQLADGSFPGRDGQPDGEATLAVLDMMNAAGISLDDDRFVKNGNTVADGLRTFYIEGVGFVSKTEVESSVDGLSDIPSYENPVMDFSSAVSALTYLQAAENGKFGPDGKGNSVFEIVGSALTETPLGAILLAVVIVALLAFGMVRRYRRIKKEQ